ncbi:MAG: AbrB/MazE/SpoVT family DNA-binding domain-containing protein [Symploca sp. SIO2G7]|nr:AbrB/MazE/SpoVT family DNA-binding domain-containing protein [Symploca sp. SIO2G7]
MPNSYHVCLDHNGQNQVLTIPQEFALPGKEVLLRKEGNRLIIEPISHGSILSLLSTLPDITDNFPDVDEALLPLDDIILF